MSVKNTYLFKSIYIESINELCKFVLSKLPFDFSYNYRAFRSAICRILRNAKYNVQKVKTNFMINVFMHYYEYYLCKYFVRLNAKM